MKLSPQLSKYLNYNKSLSLPGLGVFTVAGNAAAPTDDSSTNMPYSIVNFEEKKVTGFDNNLVEFIAKETGRMKTLTASDLESQLQDVVLILNSGKPYFFPGIGTITKRPLQGSYDFVPDTAPPLKEKRKEVTSNEKYKIPQAYIDNTKTRSKNKKSGIAILVVTLLAIAATLWFYLNSNSSADQETVHTADTAVNASSHIADSVISRPNTTVHTSAQNNFYKYILEIAAKPRAERRFAQLKKIQWPVELETIDSTTFKIVMKLPAANADTTKIKDSLSVLSGRKVFIEK